jgi:Gas vesicle protein K
MTRVDLGAVRPRIEFEPGKMERGVLTLVLSLVELLRQVMEKQAMRRIEAGSLTGEEIDRLGCSLMELESTLRELQVRFGIEDLNIDLGPIGRLVDA